MTHNIIDLNNLSIENIKLFNKINKEIKNEYHDLIEQIYIQSDKSINWLVNSLLSRNNLLSSVFLDLCYIELIKRIIETRKIEKVIVKSPFQGKVVKEYFRQTKLNIVVKCTNKYFQYFKSVLKPFYNFFQNVCTILRLISTKNSNRRIPINRNKEIILIDTYFVPDEFNNGIYISRYFPKQFFYDHIIESDRESIFFVPEIEIRKKVKRVIKLADKSDENFLYKFDYLKPSDYIYALLSPFRIKIIDFSIFKFRGFNIGPILRADFYSNIANGSSFLGILNFLFFKRIKNYGLKPKRIINWFENQVIDRGFNYGARKYYPKIETIGYQSFIVSFDYNFHLQPTLLEKQLAVIPEKIAVIGDSLIEDMKKFCQDLHVIKAPAFRFGSLFEENNIIRGNNINKSILIALPISLKESMDILSMVNSALFNELKNHKIHFYLKLHPELDFSKLKNKYHHIINEMTQVNGSFRDIIQKVDLLISNTSSVCLESLAYGTPVIVIGSQSGVTQCPIPSSLSNDMWDLCYTSKEIRKATSKLLLNNTISFKNRDKIKNYVLSNYFTDIRNDNLKSFIGID